MHLLIFGRDVRQQHRHRHDVERVQVQLDRALVIAGLALGDRLLHEIAGLLLLSIGRRRLRRLRVGGDERDD